MSAQMARMDFMQALQARGEL